MVSRYQLHAGKGRSWQTDSTDDVYYLLGSNDLKYLMTHAKTQFQEKFDWWTIFDMDEGMSHSCGWSTGRTTPHLMEADRAFSLLR